MPKFSVKVRGGDLERTERELRSSAEFRGTIGPSEVGRAGDMRKLDWFHVWVEASSAAEAEALVAEHLPEGSRVDGAHELPAGEDAS